MASTSVGSVFLNFRAGVASFNNDLKGVKKALDTTARDMERAGKNLSSALTLPIVGASTALLVAADNFQKAQKIIASGTGATGQALAGLKNDFQDLAKTVPNSLSETAKAISEVYTRTGQTGESGKALAKTFLNLSEVTGTDLNENLRNGLQLFNSWGVAQDKQISTMDMFYRASQNSGVGITQLMEAVKGADDVLQPYGISLETTTTWMAAFEKAAVDQGTVFSGLQKAMANFVKAGVTDLPSALAQSIESIKNAKTDTEGLSMAMEIFGKKAAPELFDSIRGGQIDLKNFNQEVLNGSNTIAQAAVSNRTFFEQLAVLRNNLNVSLAGAGQTLGDALLSMQPAIESLANSFANLVKWFSTLSPEVQKNTIGFIAFAAALGPLLTWMSRIVSFGGQIIGWLMKTLTMLAGTAKQVGLLSQAWSLLSGAFSGILSVGSMVAGVFSSIIGFFTSGAIIATALGAAIATLTGIFAGLSLGALAAGGDMKLFLSGFVELFYDALGAIQSAWGNFTTYLSSVWQTFVGWFNTKISELLSYLNTLLQSFGVDLPAAWQSAVQFLGNIWDKFVSWFGDKVSAITDVWQRWLSDFRSGVGAIGSLLGNESWVKWAADSEAAAQKSKKGVAENKLVLEETVPVVKQLGEAVNQTGDSLNKTAEAHENAGKSGQKNVKLVNDLLHGTKDEADKAAKAVQSLWDQLGDKKAQQGIDDLKKKIDKLTEKGAIIPDADFAQLEENIAKSYEQGAIKGGAAAGKELRDASLANAKYDLEVYKKEVAEKQVEIAKQAHQKSVNFWKGLMEDAISGSRFDFEDQFKKAATEIAAEWITLLLKSNLLASNSFGDFFGKIFNSLSGAFGNWTSSITEQLGIGNIAGQATGQAAGQAAGSAASGAATTAAGGAATGAGGTAAAGGGTIAGYSVMSIGIAGAAAATAYLVGTNTLDKANKWNVNSDEQNASNVATTFIDTIFPGIGTAIDKGLEYFGIGFGKALTKNQASLKGFEKWVEETLKKSLGKSLNFAIGDINQFDGNGWADTFWSDFGDKGGDTFSALGTAFENLLGLEKGVGGQLGALLAQNLAGLTSGESLDNIKLFLDGLGVGVEDLSAKMLEAAKAGEVTWWEFESVRQSLEKIPTEGLADWGNIGGAFQQLLESGGRGNRALISLKNVAIEAGEAGVTSFAELEQYLLKTGYSAETVSAFFQSLSQRGIQSFQDLQNASDPTLGGIIADMQTLGVKWEDFAESTENLEDGVKGLAESIRELSSAIRDIPESVNTKISANYETTGGTQKAANGGILAFAKGGVVTRPTLFPTTRGMGLMGEAGKEAILPLTTIGGKLGVSAVGSSASNFVINIDARDSQAGVEHKIMGVLQTMKDSIINEAIEVAKYQSDRGF